MRGRGLRGDVESVLDEGGDYLGLRDGGNDLAAYEDLSFAVSGGDAEVGFASFTRPVDDASHDRDPERVGEPVQGGGHLLGERENVDLGAAAGGAGDDLEVALPQPE